jgi:hypothetical protein
VLSVVTKVIVNGQVGALLSSETHVCDQFGRATNITYLDGTQIRRGYGCCGLEWETDREGVTSNYEYDALKRLWLTTRNGITVSNVYDAAGQMLATARYGTTNSLVWTYRASYDFRYLDIAPEVLANDHLFTIFTKISAERATGLGNGSENGIDRASPATCG